MKSKKVKRFFFASVVFMECVLTQAAFAAFNQNQLPSSTMPARLSEQQMSNQLSSKPVPSMPAAVPAEKKPTGLSGSEGKRFNFILNKIILVDNHVYSEETLSKIYKDKIGKKISVADLQEIVQAITNFYRNSGYVLSRAILPPQKVANGLVKIRIIEGYIDHVVVPGHPGRAAKIVEALGKKGVATKPLQLRNLEYYLRLANEVPGVTVRAVMQPSTTEAGASDLQLVTNVRSITGYLSYNNYGTRYVGPPQATGQVAFNSMFTSGDSAKIMYASVPGQPQQLRFYDVSYSFMPVANGLSMVIGKNNSISHPGFTLVPVKIEGKNTTYYAQMQYPWIRERDHTVTLDGAFNYLDSSVQSLGNLLYVDHLRTVRAGGTYNFVDRFMGSNQVVAHVVQGLTLFGATHDIHSTRTSRFGGRGDFTRMEFSTQRLQPLRGRFTLAFSTAGQYAFNPLLSSEQFGFGGSSMGRGYDPSEIIGDRGVSGSLEIRMSTAPGWWLIKKIEPYVFYDQGVIWNLKDVTGVKQKQSAASTGAGSRFVFGANFSGELFIGQPLTKSVAGLQSLNRGRKPRVFFSIVGTAG